MEDLEGMPVGEERPRRGRRPDALRPRRRPRGWPRWATFTTGLYGVPGSLIGAGVARRSVIRSPNQPWSPQGGTKFRVSARTTPYSAGTEASASGIEPARGHQNSSASLAITQSAPCSVAARRAIRVCHSACRATCDSSRITRSTPSRAYRLENLRRSVARAVVGRDHEVHPGGEVEREVGVHDVRLVPDKQRQHDLHAGSNASGAAVQFRPACLAPTCHS